MLQWDKQGCESVAPSSFSLTKMYRVWTLYKKKKKNITAVINCSLQGMWVSTDNEQRLLSMELNFKGRKKNEEKKNTDKKKKKISAVSNLTKWTTVLVSICFGHLWLKFCHYSHFTMSPLCVFVRRFLKVICDCCTPGSLGWWALC